MLLDLEIAAKWSGRLTIQGPLHKGLFELDGLGVRNLKRDKADLLVLARRGDGHPRGWCSWTARTARMDLGTRTVRCDRFRLPPAT